MGNLTLESVQACDVWPFPFCQDARSVDQDVACIGESAVVFPSQLNFPLAGQLVPSRTNDLSVQHYKWLEIVFLVEVRHISLDLWSVAVVATPLRVAIERESRLVG